MEDKTYGTLVTDCGIQLIAAAVMALLFLSCVVPTMRLALVAAAATTSRILP